jgi:O-antigen ligase
VWNWFGSGFGNLSSASLRIGIITVTLVIFTGAAFFLSRNNYVARLFNSDADSVEEFIVENYAGARAAYAYGALGAYEESPFFGVGLGASGFYIYDNLPDWAMTNVPEIARQLSPQSRLYPNPKNMYARLLAETGLIGFALFFIYFFSVLGDVLHTFQTSAPLSRFLGVAALFSWIAVLLYNATQDSFATPNIWVNFGILAGISAFSTQGKKGMSPVL